jgi:hypothetical protein
MSKSQPAKNHDLNNILLKNLQEIENNPIFQFECDSDNESDGVIE